MKNEQLIDVEQDQLELLTEIIKRHIPNKTVWAYGSRVNWKASEISDLDLAVFGCDSMDVYYLREALEESDLLFSVDVLEWEDIPENFKENIKRKYVVVQEKPELEGWREMKLEEVASKIKSGGTPPTRHKEYYGGNIPWLNTKEINFNRIVDTETKITESGLKNSSAQWVRENSVIVAMYGATSGKVAINKIPLTTNQACCNIEVDANKADYRYIYYDIFNKYNDLVSLCSGAAQQNLNVGIVKNLAIYLPPLSEQNAIAEILSSLDDKIDLLNRQNKTLEDMAQTLFQEWFVEDASSEWNENKFGDLVDFRKGRKPTRAENNQFECSAPQILIETFDTGKTLYSEREGMVFANGKDTLMVMDGASSGRLEIGFEGILGSTIGLYKPSDEFDYPFFIFCFLKSQEKYIRENTTGSAIPHADKKLVLNLIARFPNIKMVNKFEVIAESFFIKKQSNRKKIRTLENLRDTLLPKLMNGEITIAGPRKPN